MASNLSQCIRAFVLLTIAAIAIESPRAHAQTEPNATIVEFYLAPYNKYFLTAKPDEWALLDGLGSIGWKRTGLTYAAHGSAVDANAKPVCRFFHPGVVTHFYSVDAAECDLLKSLPREFVDEGIAWYAYEPSLNASAPSGKTCQIGSTALFRTFNSGTIAANGPANHRYFGDYTFYQTYAAKGYALEGLAMCLPQTTAEKRADASRLLFQATFGARPGDVDSLVTQGVSAWLNTQLNASPTRYTERAYWPLTRPDTCVNNTTPPLTEASYCQRDNYSLFQPQREFFKHAINQQSDQLLQRVAWAWSQFFVVSGVEAGMPYGMIDYQQMLRDNALGNFRELMKKVTLHAAMGRMLDMVNNRKPDGSVEPNENYARELLQLFSLGVYQLNQDGTYKRGSNGVVLDTYTQEDVENLAHIFTGWTYPTVPGQTPRAANGTANTKGYMEERIAFHYTGAKDLLGQRIDANLSQSARLDRALDIIFQHPNVAPFVSRFLIQQLVTGQPSPSYVKRVADVFVNNGSGVRGDMKAVVRAILLDIEARGAAKWTPNYGHQSEPVLALTRLARAMGTTTDGVYFRGATIASGQNVFIAPSVFNYYPPDYTLTKSGVNSPEFAIYNSATAMNRANVAYNTTYVTIGVDPTVFGATGTQFNLTSLTSVASTPSALMDRVSETLFGGRISAQARSTIETAISAVPATDAAARVRMALYLSALAPESVVLR